MCEQFRIKYIYKSQYIFISAPHISLILTGNTQDTTHIVTEINIDLLHSYLGGFEPVSPEL
jgi:hypothetical protein